jgi:redox-sensing transcriptional repressor
VRSMDDLGEVVQQENVAIGLITTPPQVAQEVADRLVEAGVTAVLNFAPTVISVPPHVSLRKVDLSIELQILSFYQQRAAVALMAGEHPAEGTPEVVAAAIPLVLEKAEGDPDRLDDALAQG